MTLTDILRNFSDMKDEEDRLRYLYELGLTLGPMPRSVYDERNRVTGCSNRVWLQTLIGEDDEGETVLAFRGDSDSHLVRGLLLIVVEVFSARRPAEILELDPAPVLESIGLAAQLNAQRTNGVRALISRIRKDARDLLPDYDKKP